MFNEEKTTALTRLILGKLNGQCPYMKVIKLLYLIDRKMIEMHDDVITSDHYVSMRYGPVLSNTLNLIRAMPDDNEEHSFQDEIWDKYIETKGYNLNLRERNSSEDQKALNLLNANELEAYRKVIDELSGKDQWELVDYTHNNCPEWSDPSPFGVMDLPVNRILRQLDKSEEVRLKFAQREIAAFNAIV